MLIINAFSNIVQILGLIYIYYNVTYIAIKVPAETEPKLLPTC